MTTSSNLYDQIETLDFFTWKRWPREPWNVLAFTIQTATKGPCHLSIAHRQGKRITQFEAVTQGFEQNAFNVKDKALVGIYRLDWFKLFEPWAVPLAQAEMIERMYRMCDEGWGYEFSGLAVAASMILGLGRPIESKPIFDDKKATICSAAGSRIARLKGLQGVKVPYENAITGDSRHDERVWPVHFSKSPNLRRIYP
jgi:hypothetical protein